jgi:hypothetical protein
MRELHPYKNDLQHSGADLCQSCTEVRQSGAVPQQTRAELHQSCGTVHSAGDERTRCDASVHLGLTPSCNNAAATCNAGRATCNDGEASRNAPARGITRASAPLRRDELRCGHASGFLTAA